MTPYEIEYLICLVTKAGPDKFDEFVSSVDLFSRTAKQFQENGLSSTDNEPTDKARFYLDYLCSVPLPIGSWKIDWQRTDETHEKPIHSREFSIPMDDWS